jgi:hypothetical protein
MQPKQPWRRVVAEFGIAERAAQQAHPDLTLPSGIDPKATQQILEMQPEG